MSRRRQAREPALDLLLGDAQALGLSPTEYERKFDLILNEGHMPSPAAQRIRRHDAHRPGNHSLSADEYDALFEQQLGVCAGCFRDARLVVDHDHSCCPSTAVRKTCGRCVRGLLCTRCNLLLGSLENTPLDLVVRLLRYIDGDNPQSVAGRMHDPIIPALRQMLEYAEEAA